MAALAINAHIAGNANYLLRAAKPGTHAFGMVRPINNHGIIGGGNYSSFKGVRMETRKFGFSRSWNNRAISYSVTPGSLYVGTRQFGKAIPGVNQAVLQDKTVKAGAAFYWK